MSARTIWSNRFGLDSCSRGSTDVKPFGRHASLWGPAVVYMALIFQLSSESAPLPGLTRLVWDKALHMVEYGGLALLLGRAFFGEGCSLWRAFFLGALTASLYGMTDEFHQLWVVGRQADVRDWLSDSLGGTWGAAGYILFQRFWSTDSGPG